MNKKFVFGLVLAACMACTVAAWAHTPIMACYLNGDGTATVEGGFSDGSSAAGVAITVRSTDGKTLQEGKMDDLGEFVFDIPEVDYEVEFNAGPGHVVVVQGKDIQ